jgi:DNA-binding transcriptional LysR family regulator
MGNALDRIEAAVAPLRRRRAQLRISTVATFASHWLIPRLADWQRRHPHIELSISTTTRMVDLAGEDVDCAIRHGRGNWKGLKATLLLHETLLPVACPDITGLSDENILIRSRFRDWNRWWRASNAPHDPPDRSLIVETRAQAMDAVLNGAGVAVMDRAYVESHVKAGRLCALCITITLPEGYYLITSDAPRSRSESLRLLESWLVGQA